jgi:hypothetical protein
MAYMRRIYPNTRFLRFKNTGHGGLAPFYPEKMVKGIRDICARQ